MVRNETCKRLRFKTGSLWCCTPARASTLPINPTFLFFYLIYTLLLLCGLQCLLFKIPAFTIVNELKSIPSLDQKDWGIVSYVSIMRLNFALDAASASTVSQLRRRLSLDSVAVDHLRYQQARLSAVSSTFYAFLFSHLFIF